MALFGRNHAFIPIGLSCQGAHQLDQNARLLARLCGEPLERRASLFDFTYISADSVAEALVRAASRPIVADSLLVPEQPDRAPMLDGARLWLWHAPPSHELTPEERLRVAQKYEHLRQNFLALATLPRRIFVLNSGQNNIAGDYPAAEGHMAVTLTPAIVAKVKLTLDRLFPEGRNALLVAGKAERIAPGLQAHLLPPDDTPWKGDDVAWAKVFEAHFADRGLLGRWRRPLRRLLFP